MKQTTIAVLGTGMVGKALATALVERGHSVTLGSRKAVHDGAAAWAAAHGENAHQSDFASAAAASEIVLLAVKGEHAEAVVAAAGAGADGTALDGKVLVDITNPLDFSQGMPPSLFVFGRDSLAERVQRAAPKARVVKTLNTVNASVMVDPGRVEGTHAVFVSGDDDGAKATVKALLEGFGWQQIIDLGDLSTARGTEAYLLLWLRLWQATGSGDINIALHRAAAES